MKRKRYSVEQIVAAVRQHDLGVSAADIARKLGIASRECQSAAANLGSCGVQHGASACPGQMRVSELISVTSQAAVAARVATASAPHA